MEEKDVQLLLCFVFKLTFLADQAKASNRPNKYVEIAVFKTIKSLFQNAKNQNICHLNIVFKNFEEPGEKLCIEIRRVLPPAAAHLARTAHLPDRP